MRRLIGILVFIVISLFCLCSEQTWATREWVSLDQNAMPGTPPDINYTKTQDGFTIDVDIYGFWKESIEVEGEEFKRIIIPEYNNQMNKGLPELPIMHFTAYLPDGMTYSVQYSVNNESILSKYYVYPYQDYILNNRENIFSKNTSIYIEKKDILYPKESLTISEPINFYNRETFQFSYIPMKFNPASETINIHKSFSLSVIYENGNSEEYNTRSDLFFSESYIENLMRKKLINYDMLVDERDDLYKLGASELPIAYPLGYLVIAADGFFYDSSGEWVPDESLTQLITWKEKKGLDVVLKRRSDITNNASAKDIKDYILTVYNSMLLDGSSTESRLRYILLIGDAGGIDNKWIIPPSRVFDSLHTYTAGYIVGSCPTQDVDYTIYDLWSDIEYGVIEAATYEYEDFEPAPGYHNSSGPIPPYKDILRPEALIGRLSAQNTDTLQILVRKIIDYETRPFSDDESNEWFNDMLLTSQDNDPDDGDRQENIEAIINHTNGYKSIYDIEIVSRAAFSNGTSYSNQINQSINDGKSVVIYVGHGFTDGWASGYKIDNIDGMSNGGKLPVVCTEACETSTFQEDSFSERIVRYDDESTPEEMEGAIAAFGANQETTSGIAHNVCSNIPGDDDLEMLKYGLGNIIISAIPEVYINYNQFSEDTIYSAFSNELTREEFDNWCSEEQINNIRYALWESWMLKLYSFNLLGDPNLYMWAGSPLDIDIDVISYDAENNEIEVCLKYKGIYINSETTEEDGEGYLDAHPEGVTVSAIRDSGELDFVATTNEKGVAVFDMSGWAGYDGTLYVTGMADVLHKEGKDDKELYKFVLPVEKEIYFENQYDSEIVNFSIGETDEIYLKWSIEHNIPEDVLENIDIFEFRVYKRLSNDEDYSDLTNPITIIAVDPSNIPAKYSYTDSDVSVSLSYTYKIVGSYRMNGIDTEYVFESEEESGTPRYQLYSNTLGYGFNLYGLPGRIYYGVENIFPNNPVYDLYYLDSNDYYSYWTDKTGFVPEESGLDGVYNPRPASAYLVYNDRSNDSSKNIYTVYGLNLDSGYKVRFELQDGWNFITNPFSRAYPSDYRRIDWGDTQKSLIQVLSGETTSPLIDTINNSNSEFWGPYVFRPQSKASIEFTTYEEYENTLEGSDYDYIGLDSTIHPVYFRFSYCDLSADNNIVQCASDHPDLNQDDIPWISLRDIDAGVFSGPDILPKHSVLELDNGQEIIVDARNIEIAFFDPSIDMNRSPLWKLAKQFDDPDDQLMKVIKYSTDELFQLLSAEDEFSNDRGYLVHKGGDDPVDAIVFGDGSIDINFPVERTIERTVVSKNITSISLPDAAVTLRTISGYDRVVANANDEFQVPLRVVSQEPVFGVALEVEYDPALMTLLDGDEDGNEIQAGGAVPTVLDSLVCEGCDGENEQDGICCEDEDLSSGDCSSCDASIEDDGICCAGEDSASADCPGYSYIAVLKEPGRIVIDTGNALIGRECSGSIPLAALNFKTGSSFPTDAAGRIEVARQDALPAVLMGTDFVNNTEADVMTESVFLYGNEYDDSSGPAITMVTPDGSPEGSARIDSLAFYIEDGDSMVDWNSVSAKLDGATLSPSRIDSGAGMVYYNLSTAITEGKHAVEISAANVLYDSGADTGGITTRKETIVAGGALLHLKIGSFDPVYDPPRSMTLKIAAIATECDSEADSDEFPRQFILQCMPDDWENCRESLQEETEINATFNGIVSNNAYWVRFEDLSSYCTAMDKSYIRAAIPWLADNKMSKSIMLIEPESSDKLTARIELWDSSSASEIEQLIVDYGGNILKPYSSDWNRFVVSMKYGDLLEIAENSNIAEIQREYGDVEMWGVDQISIPPSILRVREDADPAIAPFAWNIMNLNGTGQIIGIVDSGGFGTSEDPSNIDDSIFHPDFRGGRVLARIDAGDDDLINMGSWHGTEVAGILAGDGTNSSVIPEYNASGAFRGMAPSSSILYIDRIQGGNSAFNATENINDELLAFSSGENKAYISNHSYGSDEDLGLYTSERTRIIDQFLNANPKFTYVYAVGNGFVSTQATAKNDVSVGAVKFDMVSINSGSTGVGPTGDNRIKPDVVALDSEERPYLFTTSDPDSSVPGFQYIDGAPYYNVSRASSIAAPQVSGILALISEYFRNNAVSGRLDDVNNVPASALLKAALINGAMRAPEDHDFGIHGWGWPNLRNSIGEHAEFGDYAYYYIEDSIGDDGDCNKDESGDEDYCIYEVPVSSHYGMPMKVTLVWTDPPCTSGVSECSSNSALINNLDLELKGADKTYYGNDLEGFPQDAMAYDGDGILRDVNNNVEQAVSDWDDRSHSFKIKVRWNETPPSGTSQKFAVVAYNGNEILKKMEFNWDSYHDFFAIPLHSVKSVMGFFPQDANSSRNVTFYAVTDSSTRADDLGYYDFVDGSNLIRISDVQYSDFSIGNGLWLKVEDFYSIFKDLERGYGLIFTGTPVAYTDEVSVSLEHGWNLISNPYDGFTYWDNSIMVSCNGDDSSSYVNLSQAIRQTPSIVSRGLVEYTTVAGEMTTSFKPVIYPATAKINSDASLVSGNVYALFVDDTDTSACPDPFLKFAQRDTSYTIETVDDNDSLRKPEWVINITAGNAGLGTDGNNYVGLLPGSESWLGDDWVNIRKPPSLPIEKKIRLAVTDNNIDYMASFRNYSSTPVNDLTWNITLSHNDSTGDITESTQISIDSIPNNYVLTLEPQGDYDGDGFIDPAWNFSNGLTYTLQNPQDDDFQYNFILRASFTISYTGTLMLDGKIATNSDKGEGIVADFYAGTTLLASVDAADDGSISSGKIDAADKVVLSRKGYIVDTVDISNPTNSIIDDDMLRDLTPNCAGFVPCLRAGNPSDENIGGTAMDDRRKYSVRLDRTTNDTASYKSKYLDTPLATGVANPYIFDTDVLSWHMGDRSEALPEVADVDTYDMDANGIVNWRDVALVNNVAGCTASTCGERCFTANGEVCTQEESAAGGDCSCDTATGLPNTNWPGWAAVDFDGDSTVSEADWDFMTQTGFTCFGSSPSSSNWAVCQVLDLDRSGGVNFGDYQILDNMVKDCGDVPFACSAQCVPASAVPDATCTFAGDAAGDCECATDTNDNIISWSRVAGWSGDTLAVETGDSTLLRDATRMNQWSDQFEARDIDGDGVVSWEDVYILKKAFGATTSANAGWCFADRDNCPVQGMTDFFDPYDPANLMAYPDPENPGSVIADETVINACCLTKYQDPTQRLGVADADISGDGNVNAFDLSAMKAYFMAGVGPRARKDALLPNDSTQTGADRLDFNYDGKVNLFDLPLWQKGKDRCDDLQDRSFCFICRDDGGLFDCRQRAMGAD